MSNSNQWYSVRVLLNADKDGKGADKIFDDLVNAPSPAVATLLAAWQVPTDMQKEEFAVRLVIDVQTVINSNFR